MKGEDCNLDIMPPRKKNKEPNKLNIKKTTLSKTQKRKLKKLEEEKEKELISAKTAELLDKYKITEEVSSLLQSSKAIRRLEKRRRPMQLSKAGVVSEHSNEENDDSDSCMDEPTTPEHAENHIPSLQTDSSDQLVHANELESKVMIPAEHVVDMDLLTAGRDDDEEGYQRMDESEGVAFQGPASVVHVSRPAEVEQTRKNLPIIMMEQEIMEAINYHPTVIISGRTGCGKTTQVPQFLYEAGYGSKKFSSRSGVIGVTQPRRVAVVATAKRVAHELGVRLGQEVGYQVRYDKKIGENSAIKFMTDGILLREIQDDSSLSRYSVIILDEAHERSVNTDILIGMLTLVIKIRQEHYKDHPLKLILMSATLRVEDFVSSGKRLFPKPPPVIEVPTRQYSVTIHFSKKTKKVDYINEAYKKVMSIHKKLPQGGILVFVTGQRDVDCLCRKLGKSSKELAVQAARRDAETFDDDSNYSFDSYGEDPFDEEVYDTDEESDWETVDDDGHACTEAEVQEEKKAGKLRVLPLYAMLSSHAQLRVFEEVEEGERLVVVATNVAETSLTIPGIKYVVDTGLSKAKNYNIKTGAEKYEVDWISQASASQRAGRAGRTGPGHCYRLYSSAVFSNTFKESSPPQITKVPLDGVVLYIKSMVDISNVENFPFPTPPETSSIREAERCLKTLEALDSNGSLTPLGKAMSVYPMSPRHSKMLLTVIQMLKEAQNYSRANLVLGYAVAAVAALTLPNPLTMQFEGDVKEDDDDKQQWRKDRKDKIKAARDRFSNPSSDALTVAYVLHSFEAAENRLGFCESNGLHWKTMEEMSKLKDELLRHVFTSCNSSETEHLYAWTHGTIEDVEKSWRNTGPSKNPLLQKEEELLGEAICAGWADRVARKTKSTEYQACAVQDEPVFLHRWSSLINSAPELLVYSELLDTCKKPYMHRATQVKPEWLVKHAKSLCIFSTPLKDPKPYYSREVDRVFCLVVPSFGPHLWELPPHSEEVREGRDRAAVFGCALLRGEVLPCLKSVRALLAGKPETLLEREAWGLKRVGSLARALQERKIDSLQSLRKSWEQNPYVLYSEVEAWFQKKSRHHVKELWQIMLQEAQVVPFERSGKLNRAKR